MALATLGKVTVTTAGTIARATNGQSTPGARVSCQSFMVQALPANTGVIYVGNSAMVSSTGVGVMGIVPKPASNLTGPFPSISFAIVEAPNGINLADIWLDASVSGEGAIISYTVQ